MSKSENKNVVEVHGCLVCAKLFDMLVEYTPEGGLLNCTVTSPGGHIVPDEQRPLVACDTHTVEDIEIAYIGWQSRFREDSDNPHEDE